MSVEFLAISGATAAHRERLFLGGEGVIQDAARHLHRPQALSGPRRELFRAESLQEQRTLWLGRHTLSLGLSATLSSIVSTVLVVAAAAFVAFGSYARRVELHGVVLPSTGLVHVTSPVAGWVEALNVRDGDSIAGGTPLYTLNTDTATRNGDTQQQILRSLAAQRSILLL